MYGQEFGAVLNNPQRNPGDTLMLLKQQQEEQRRYEAEQQWRQREYKDKWLMHAANKLDPSQWADIVSPYGKIVTSTLDTGMKDIMQYIRENPDDHAGLLTRVGNVAGQVNRFYTKGKETMAGIDGAVQQYAKNPSVDTSMLKRLTVADAFFDPKTEGPRDPSEIGDDDYVRKNLYKAITGPQHLFKTAEGMPVEEMGSREKTRNKAGFVRDVKWEAKVRPYQEKYTDEEGNVALRVRSTPETLSNGQKVAAMDEKAFSLFIGDEVNDATLTAQMRQAGMDRLPAPDQMIMRRVLAKQLLDSYPIGGVKNADVELAPAPRVTVVNNNGSGAPQLDVNGIIRARAAQFPNVKSFAVNHLPEPVQAAVIKQVNELTGGRDTGGINSVTNAPVKVPYDQGSIIIGYTPEGRLAVYQARETDLRDRPFTNKQGQPARGYDPKDAPLMFIDADVNIKAQPSTKGQNAAIQNANAQRNQPKPSPKKDPLGLF